MLANRLTSRISSWILTTGDNLDETGSLVLQTHHDLLANCDFLTGRLLGKDDEINTRNFDINSEEIGSGPSSNTGSFLIMSRIKNKDEKEANLNIHSNSSSDSSSFSGNLLGDAKFGKIDLKLG